MITSPLIRVTVLLADDRPPFRVLWEGDLPAVPDAGEPFAFNQRTYRVVERAWRMGTEQKDAGTIEPIVDTVMKMGVGLLVTQIAGDPHVVLGTGSLTAN